MRRDAVQALEDIGTPEAIPMIELAARDPHPSVADEARKALERLARPRK